MRRLKRILVEALEEEAMRVMAVPPGRFARPGNVLAILPIGKDNGGNHHGDQNQRGRMTTTSELKPLLKRLRLGYLLNTLPQSWPHEAGQGASNDRLLTNSLECVILGNKKG